MIGPEPSMIPLALQIESAVTQDGMHANVDATIARGYVPFTGYLDSRKGAVHICGGGPSLAETWQDIPEGEDIFAINSAIGYLIRAGRAPRYAMIWDASEVCEAFAVPHPDVTYLIAARCHPKVFERLSDCRVVVWYAGGDHDIMDFMRERKIAEPAIFGGSAGVTRGLFVAYAMGWREIHLHGADSSFQQDDRTHVDGASLVAEKRLPVHVCGRDFLTTPELCGQVEEIKLIYPMFTTAHMGASITAHGDGMLPHIVRYMAQNPLEAAATAIESLIDKATPKTLQPLEGVPA